MNEHLLCFYFAMAGNAAVEALKVLVCARKGAYHIQYGDWRFWFARVVMVVLSGVLAMAFSMAGASSPILAFHLGAAATIVIGQMEKRPPAGSRQRKRRMGRRGRHEQRQEAAEV